jgi:hypothetical protein
MAFNRSTDRLPVSVAEALLTRIASEGSSRHVHLNALVEAGGPHIGRDLADAIHLLCSLRGRHPGVVELAFQRCEHGPVKSWLRLAADVFEKERLYLVRLTSAVGPVPSTPGAAQTEASLNAQRNALETLALSERNGCALGAVTALMLDWAPVRRLLDRTADRLGIVPPPVNRDDQSTIVEVLEQACAQPSVQRAMTFGAEQLLLQHRALFELLEARASARGDY